MRRRLACVPALLALLAAGPLCAESGRRLATDGSWTALKIEAPGDKQAFGFEQRSGCRYRMTVEPQTLARPVVDLAFGEMPPQRFGAPERGQSAVYAWDAEGTRLVWAEVSGFSAMTGTARIKVESLGPDGAPQKKPEPWLGVTAENARMGDLMLGEVERWPLVLEPGRAYRIEPTRGSAFGLLLRVVTSDGRELAKSLRPWLPFDELRLRAPPEPPLPEPGPPGSPIPEIELLGPPLLEMRGLAGCGGTYGLRLSLLPDDEPLVAPPSPPLAAVERGPLDGERLGFRVNPGDVALLFSPQGPSAMAVASVQRQVGALWEALGPEVPVGTLRSQEGDHMACFRAEQPGTYRFEPFPVGSAANARPLLFAGEELGGAPLLLGLATDPRVRAKVGSAWRTVGLAVVVPGFDYLFVAEGAPGAGVAMRVRGTDGKVLASRPAHGEALTLAAGLGPSLRFKAAAVTLLRLEVQAKGKGQTLLALLRRASN